jgi:hypothetical protein
LHCISKKGCVFFFGGASIVLFQWVRFPAPPVERKNIKCLGKTSSWPLQNNYFVWSCTITHLSWFSLVFFVCAIHVKWSKTMDISRDRARSHVKDIKHNMCLVCRDHNIHGSYV